MKYVNIDKNEVLRYLGYRDQKIEKNLDDLIDRCMVEIVETAKPLHVYEVFSIESSEEGIKVLGTNLILKGKAIYNHLKDARKCAIMASTLGIDVDNKIRILGKTDMTKSFILDACATDMIEKVCDSAEDEIKEKAKSEGLKTNFRFSPGYGDLPINIQGEIISILNANRLIGLTTTESSIMIPRKSVTAIIGFLDVDIEVNKKIRTCDSCNLNSTCKFKKDGGSCGN